MKRKFSFNLAPVKIQSKNNIRNAKNTPEPTPSNTNNHRRHTSKDSITTLNSPYICRRAPLDPQTERELRIACKLILRNFKPSDHGFTDVDPKLDFQGMATRREHKDHHRIGPAEVRVRPPTGAPADSRHVHDARKNVHVADTVVAREQLPTQANTGRRRTDRGDSMDKTFDPRRTGKTSTNDVSSSRSATMRTDMDSDDGKSLGTPLTSSTDAHMHTASTAPTSAAMASGVSSKRASRQFDNAAAAADAQASEWMRQELERRRRDQPSQSQPYAKTAQPPPTRSKSVRSGIKDYIFPGSSTLTRAQSQESLHTMDSQTSSQKELKRKPSTSGWRSWGLQRKSSSRSSSRPGTSKGRLENQESDRRPEVNLNRELPPLPSLDSWREQEQQRKNQENRKSQAQGAHIATVMRSPDQQQQDYAAAVRRHHRRSGSDTLALRYANTSFAQSSPQIARSASKSQQTSPKPLRSPHAPDHSMDFDDLMSAMESTKDISHQLRLATPGQTYSQTANSATRSPSLRPSHDNGRLVPTTNFSRKISADIAGSQRGNETDGSFSNTVQVASQTGKQKAENRSVFRKVFSSWASKKEKKNNWMDKLEKDGIKEGVMIQDEAALPPVVRY